jgi:hypothetical protein
VRDEEDSQKLRELIQQLNLALDKYMKNSYAPSSEVAG